MIAFVYRLRGLIDVFSKKVWFLPSTFSIHFKAVRILTYFKILPFSSN